MEGISHEAASIAGFLRPGAADRDLRRQPHQPRRADQPGVRRGRARRASRPTAGGSCAWTTATTSRRSTRALAEAEVSRRPPHADRLPHPHRLRLAPQAGHLGGPRLAARRRGGRGRPSAPTAGPRTPTFLVPDEVAAWAGGAASRGAPALGGRVARARRGLRRRVPGRGRGARARAATAGCPRAGRRRRRAFPDGRVDGDAGGGREGPQRLRRRGAGAGAGRGRPLLVHQHDPEGHGRRGAAATTPAATSTTASASTRWARSPTASRPTAACARSAPPSSRSRTT